MDDITQHCPPPVIQRIATTDLASEAGNGLFSWVASHADLPCQVLALVAVARRMHASVHPAVVADFCRSAATYARFIPEDARPHLKAAYERMPYSESIHAAWFAGLRLNGIDIRSRMQSLVGPEDWSFTHPRRNAETWHHHLYLASLGTAGAYEKLADKIARTANGNDATNLLKSFAELRTPEARAILMRYASDPRRAEGPERLELPISETVKLLLKQLY